MNLPYRLRPGGGLWVLVIVGLISTAFFAWGLATPDLDRVWTLELEMQLGQRDPLSLTELKLVQDALCRHPELVEDWPARSRTNDRGYAYLVRPAGGTQALVVSTDPSVKANRLSLRARTVDATREATAAEGEPVAWNPPQHGTCPTLIELVITDGKKKKRSGLVSLR